MIAAIPLCLPIIAPAPSVTQLFIFFSSSWQSSTVFWDTWPTLVQWQCRSYVLCAKSLSGAFHLRWHTSQRQQIVGVLTDMSVTSSARQPNTSEDAAALMTLSLIAFPRKRSTSRIEPCDQCWKCFISCNPSLSNNVINNVAFVFAFSFLAIQLSVVNTFLRALYSPFPFLALPCGMVMFSVGALYWWPPHAWHCLCEVWWLA